MSGLILLAVLGLWIAAVTVLTRFLTKAIRPSLFRLVIQLLIFVGISIAPVADDIIGGIQFRALCEAETAIAYDKERLANKKVKFQLSDAVGVDYMIISVISQTWNYQDIESDETLMSYKTLDAKGGWLSRAIGFQSLSNPFTFDGHCGPGWQHVDEIFRSLHVTVTNN